MRWWVFEITDHDFDVIAESMGVSTKVNQAF